MHYSLSLKRVKTEWAYQINPSTFPGLKLGVCSGLILRGIFDPVLKDGVWRRRSIKKEIETELPKK